MSPTGSDESAPTVDDFVREVFKGIIYAELRRAFDKEITMEAAIDEIAGYVAKAYSPTADDLESRAFDQVSEAARIVCLRAQQFGFRSTEIQSAHEVWRRAWLRWSDIYDECHAGKKDGTA